MDENGNVNQNALKLRITDNYLETLSRIYSEVKIVGLPEPSANGDSSNPLSAENIATAMVLFKQITGKDNIGQMSAADIHGIQKEMSSLKSGLDDVNKNVKNQTGGQGLEDKVRYLDSKTLFWRNDTIYITFVI